MPAPPGAKRTPSIAGMSGYAFGASGEIGTGPAIGVPQDANTMTAHVGCAFRSVQALRLGYSRVKQTYFDEVAGADGLAGVFASGPGVVAAASAGFSGSVRSTL